MSKRYINVCVMFKGWGCELYLVELENRYKACLAKFQGFKIWV